MAGLHRTRNATQQRMAMKNNKRVEISEQQWDVMRSLLLSNAEIDLSQVIIWACRHEFYGELPPEEENNTPEYALFYGLFV